jgi:hypothetical protein
VRPAAAEACGRLAAGAVLAILAAGPAAAATVDISGLQDVTFSNLDPTVSVTRRQSLCVFSNALLGGYSVTARGSGSGSAFTLSAGGSVAPLPYQVQWSGVSGASSGTALSPSIALTGLASNAITLTCALGPSSSASLIVTLRASDLQAAGSGLTYAGTLNLTIAPD